MYRQLSAEIAVAYIFKMKLKFRFAFFAFGVLVFFWGYTELKQGHFVWENWRGYNVFSPGIMALGALFAALSLVPPYRQSKQRRVRKAK